MANVKISQLTAKAATLERTDRLAIADFNGSTYDSKYLTGAEVVQMSGVKYSASHTLNLDNSYYMVEIDSSSAQTVTIPLNGVVPFPVGTVIYVCQLGTGQVTIDAAVGVTLRSSNAEYKTNGQYSVIVLRKRLTNEWVMWGDKTT
jgi:hypothetical protein